MKVVLLCAGYGTRLSPLTDKVPKALLPIGGRPLLDHVVERIPGRVDGIVVVVNHRFFGLFEEWRARLGRPVMLVDNGTVSVRESPGALKDLSLGLAAVDDDVIVLAGDTLFDFSLDGPALLAGRTGRAVIVVKAVADRREIAGRYGCVSVDAQGAVTSFAEKPAVPASDLAATPFYVFNRAQLPLVKEVLASSGRKNMGDLIAALVSRTVVLAWRMPGERYDVGTLQDYERVRRLPQFS